MTKHSPIKFAAIGLNHAHIYGQVHALLKAGAELGAFYAAEPELIAEFAKAFPFARLTQNAAEILEDSTIELIASAAIPNERAALGMAAMRHGKDFMTDKPGLTSLAQLEEVRRVQAETKRIYSIYYSERFSNPATVKAGDLVHNGAIGKVMQVSGFGPHRLNAATRPAWFFEREKYGGILTDIASHQLDQFLFFSGATSGKIVASQVANYHHPAYPELEDFGEVLLKGDNGTSGYFRVDWFTPNGLAAWGDTRLIVLGTDGYIEVRKNCDIGGKPDGNHLFLVDHKGTHYFDCSSVPLPYGRQLLEDIQHRTETAMSQKHCFEAARLALEAQAQAQYLVKATGK